MPRCGLTGGHRMGRLHVRRSFGGRSPRTAGCTAVGTNGVVLGVVQTERLLHLIYKITATQGKKHAYQVGKVV